jgi:trehalose/maltose hydrolase-like predicted phosphorylase
MKNIWNINKSGFEKADIELNGSKFLIGNGYMGYRGTMEEYGSEQLVAVNLAGFFDLARGSNWRESVNAPNPLYTVVSVGEKELNTATFILKSHEQNLDIRNGIHSRKTTFDVDGVSVTISSERFVSMARENVIALKYSVVADNNISVTVKTGIDCDIWDISGKHLEGFNKTTVGNILKVEAKTVQKGNEIKVFETIDGVSGFENICDKNLLHVMSLDLQANKEITFTKICGIYHSEALLNAEQNYADAVNLGYEILKTEHISVWDKIWDNSDVVIEGDEEAQLALRYSIYHLCSIAPRNTDKCGIPARGLSGQVYKGAAFWDTEMFMLPFFTFTDENVARNLIRYRINTLEGAKRKAAEFGKEGAFFAWESQETGDDACTLFNVSDIFTGRPLRTYFKDKQIHVSADIVFAMWDYCRLTGDYSILRDGGLELMYECLWFYYTYSSFKPYKNRYELLDVVGPDEYHERVDNNAFTNKMVAHAANLFIEAIEKSRELYSTWFDEFVKEKTIGWAYDFAENMYVPQPNNNGVIEQFDGYFKMEDVHPEDLKKRELKENEYWGCHGLASTTRVLKQADVIMMLNVFRNEYSNGIKQINWDFYEPYTEHGSSLSACAYAIVAAGIGYTEWAYKYFMKTACVDLTGNTKQYLGSLYIGGTHPAANGGAWNTAIFGFAGVSYTNDTLDISPRLPKNWSRVSFKLKWNKVQLNVNIESDKVTIKAMGDNIEKLNITVNGKRYLGI